jgi:hypothetical protein
MKTFEKLHLKIEAKGKVKIIDLYNQPNNTLSMLDIYKLITNYLVSNDLFILPYKVQKLSKRARRNQI